MTIATVSSKGQITLPSEARKALGIRPHDRVVIEVRDNVILIKTPPDFFELEGFLGQALSPEEEGERMRRGIAEHVMEPRE